ncbi:hypothetical protein STRTUCAR8_08949 [Streptomyces turgidiscabies Car8]|uniref:Uncharacterized protein n=1 Tax=Streptomyces turgidiscabies (strain Car8) TaxID=698760 RepID=L7EYD4_STRT8|nr:hypothetical protein STRTUCAR8_08949 [Streptomyces turgidiscabies Car8]
MTAGGRYRFASHTDAAAGTAMTPPPRARSDEQSSASLRRPATGVQYALVNGR